MDDGKFIRYESAYPDHDGAHLGIFCLINVLGRRGMLSPIEEVFRREANAWYDAAYPVPGQADPTIYDRGTNPLTQAWFKITATHLIDRVPPYLAVLDAHQIAWRERRYDNPGHILYEDAFQVVTVPPHLRDPSVAGPTQLSS